MATEPDRPARNARSTGVPLVRGTAVLLTLFCSASVRAEVFVEVAFGGALTHPSTITVERPGGTQKFSDVAVRTRSFESPPHYMIRVGYFFPGQPQVGVSLALLHLKYFPARDLPSSEGTRLDSVFERFSISHGYNHFPLELAIKLPVNDRFAPYISLGPSVLVLHPEVNYVEGESPEHRYLFGGIGFNATIGARYFLWNWLGVVGEYRVSASDGHFQLGADRFTVTERSHHFHLGVTTRPADVF